MHACRFFAFTSDEGSFGAGNAVVLAPVNDFGPPGALIGQT